jgi:predicted MFS family arabinose efflux permease
VICAAWQAASFLPLIVGAVRGSLPGWLVFAAAASYWAAGMAISPAWNAWVEHLVPRAIRNSYFATRTGAAQLAVVVGLIGGGLVLQRAAEAGAPMAGFVLLFGAAAAARGLSAVLLGAQSDRGARIRDETARPALPILRRVPSGPGARLLFYLLGLTGAATIASPFFSPYMLAQLNLSYERYMILVAASLAGKVLIFPALPPLARRFGLRALLWFAWIGIVPSPVLWLVSDAYPYLLVIQAASGIAWAAHEYASFLLLFELVDARRRVAILTTYNLINAVATVGGSAIGAVVLQGLGGGREAYWTIFAASGAARLLALFFLARIPAGRGEPPPILFRPIAVRPSAGAIFRPILATVRRRRSAGAGPAKDRKAPPGSGASGPRGGAAGPG